MKYTICFLSSAHPAQDKRVFEKEAVTLAQHGFSVAHLTPDEGPERIERGVRVLPYHRKVGSWARLTQLPRLYRLAAAVNADAYHCNEADSWLVGLCLKIRRRKRVVFDVHEHYPGIFAERYFPRALRPAAAGAMRLLFRILAAKTDHIVLAKQSLVADFQGVEHKLVLARNFPVLAYQTAQDEPRSTATSAANCVCAVHLGLISRTRCWPQLLEALAQTESRALRLHLIGTFNDGSRPQFDERVTTLGLADRVQVDEWMPFAAAYQRLLASHVGLVLLEPGKINHIHAFPHKMFDYMMAGLPVVVPSFAEEISRIVREADCGLLVDPSRPDELARALHRLAADPALRRRLGENGRRAVLEKYNWEKESEGLIRMYTELAEQRR